ncbi:uncharacterized protein MEPE_01384 [Melanopsichium pennsylvanicum]|uniref:Uncharacterized protein n=1 Tax=Melanopsichium pennsylvanicum TaxID=63383 RepID=A0AAJ5C3M1_9BASI|nr:uncharacterized protein MEPE_01384 [Melanopsichium pennsylvanicum]
MDHLSRSRPYHHHFVIDVDHLNIHTSKVPASSYLCFDLSSSVGLQTNHNFETHTLRDDQSSMTSTNLSPISTTIGDPWIPSLFSNHTDQTSSVTGKLITSQQSEYVKRPFSPLTLDQLGGLNPPATPTALLDITKPVSPSISEEDTTSVSNAISKRISKSQGDASQYDSCKDGVDTSIIRPQQAKSVPVCKGVRDQVSEPTEPKAFFAAYHDSFLTSFLQSLEENPIVQVASSSTDPNKDEALASSNSITRSTVPQSSTIQPSALEHSTDEAPSAVLDQQGTMPRLESPFPKDMEDKDLGSASTAPEHDLLHQTYAADFRRLSQAKNAAPSDGSKYWTVHQTSNREPSAAKRPSSSICSDPKERASSSGTSNLNDFGPSCASFLPLDTDCVLVTSPPLVRDQSSASSATCPNLSTKGRSTQLASDGRAKTEWSVDLKGLPCFTLPQAPPLQPKHRYPISILEGYAHYELDQGTDRESEPGATDQTRLSCSDSIDRPTDSLISTITAVRRKSLNPATSNEKQSFASFPQSSSPTVAPQGKAPASAPASSSWVREAPKQHLNGEGSAADGLLKVVPLSSVVRSRSWSSASHPSSECHDAPVWLTGLANAMQSDRSAKSDSTDEHYKVDQMHRYSSLSATKSRSSVPTDSKISNVTSTGLDPSHDFTRQALLDFIRRTSLGTASCASSGELSGDTSPENASADKAPKLDAPARSTLTASSSWSSTVPAELQARLQQWQHHRKRQELQAGSAKESTKDKPPSSLSSDTAALSASTHDTSAPNPFDKQKIRPRKRKGVVTEQEQKSRKQEHYQRLLLQLQAQMRMKMQMEKQKQKEPLGEAMRDSTESKDSQSKGSNFRQPSRPPKSKTGKVSHKMSIGSKSNTISAEGTSHGYRILGTVAAALSKSDKHKKEGATGTYPALADNRKEEVDLGGPIRLSSGGVAGTMSLAAHSPPALSLPTQAWQSSSQSTSMGLYQSHPAWPPAQRQDAVLWPSPSAYQYSQSSAPVACPWQRNQPSWYDGIVSSNQTTSLASSGVWSSDTFRDSFFSTNADLATELMLKHPNGFHDMPSLIPVAAHLSTSIPAPQYTDPSPLSISTATEFWPNSTTKFQKTADRRKQMCSAQQPSVKRPFSQGDEVVFWAVKGEHSVKMVGTVERMTNRNADIVVPLEVTGSMSLKSRSAESVNIHQGINGQYEQQEKASASVSVPLH